MRWIAATLLCLGAALCLPAQDELADQIRSAQASGNYNQAAQLYLKLVASGSDSPEVRSNCGIMLHLAGRNREAMAQFRIALKQNPSLASANLFAGLTEFDLGEVKAALPYLKRAQELDPSRPAPLLALGKAYVALREFELANEAYLKATALDSGLAEAWYGLGVTDRSLAEELLNRAAHEGKSRNDSTNPKVQQHLNEALSALSRAIELDPDSARTHLIMAESLSDAGRIAEAIPEYQKALKLDPWLEAGYLGLATEYWKQSQFDEALPFVKHVLLKSPKDPEANGIMADILEHRGDEAGATQHAEIALEGNPNLIETRIVLARIYLAKQDPKLAIAELRKVISADPDGSYHFLLYRAYRQAGDEEAAKVAIAEFQRLRYHGQNQ